jgi:hypothetical protein
MPMMLGLHLFGMRKNLLHQLPEDVAKRQVNIYNLLALMLLVLSILGAASGLIYGLVIFNNWAIAVGCAVLLGFIFFLLLQLLLFLSLQTRFKEIKSQLSNMNNLYEQYKDHDLSGISDEEALEMTTNYRMTMRESAIIAEPTPFHFSQLIISTLFVSIILTISFLVASAIQIWMYRTTLNNTFFEIKNSTEIVELAEASKKQEKPLFLEQKMEAVWTLQMLTPAKGEDFKFVNCQSILMTFDVLFSGLGNTKIVIDLLFALLYLIPFLIVKRSEEVAGGALLKEASIEAIGKSYLMFLLSSRDIQKTKRKIETTFDYDKVLGIK